MDKTGPGKFGGSRDTVRKREQRKRKVSREQEVKQVVPMVRKPVPAATPISRPVLDRSEANIEHRLEMMAYELVTIATQLRKSLNTYGTGLPKSSPVIEDSLRANKIIYGMVKDNIKRCDYEAKNKTGDK